MDRRLKLVRFSAVLLVELFKPGRRCFDIAGDGLPEDAQFVSVATNPGKSYGLIEVVVRSGSFPEVPEGVDLTVFRPPLDITHFPCACKGPGWCQNPSSPTGPPAAVASPSPSQ